MTPLESLTAKIHALCPELCLTAGGKTFYPSPINLDYVLKAFGLAYKNYGAFSVGSDGSFQNWAYAGVSWTSGLPLDQQPLETIKFLDDLLPNPNQE